MTKPTDYEPYQTDMEYMTDELEYVLVRARRAAAEREDSGESPPLMPLITPVSS